MEKMNISQNLFNQICSANACESLIHDKAKKVFKINGKIYVCVGSVGTGTGAGCSNLDLCECVLKNQFKGRSLSHSERHEEIWKGIRERSYKDQYFICEGNYYVIITDKITAYPISEPKQVELF